NICPNGIIEPYPNLSNSLSYLFFIPYSGFQVYEVHPRNPVSSGFLARNRFYSRNLVSLYFTYLESAVYPYANG
ncbi:hypothetical protein QUA03_20845, partial [Microcoleus sp. S36b_A4]|uniref:hypothetical protein n=1 Tax=Microcoleus sp. S36b_A4 TaxID=3055420 RepID=UPI002FD73503